MTRFAKRDGDSGFPDAARESGPIATGRSFTGPDNKADAAPIALESPTPERVLEIVLLLARGVSAEMRREEIARSYMDAIDALFPGRGFACRLLGEGDEPSSVRCSAQTLAGRIDGPELTRESLRRHSVTEENARSRGIRVVDAYQSIFTARAHGFDVPILDGDAIVGVLAIEYPPSTLETDGDRATIVQLAVHMGAALRNARLLRESIYLRNFLERLFESANAPIVVTGRSREVRVVNRAFLTLLGIERERLLRKDVLATLPEAERIALGSAIKRALRGETTSHVEVRFTMAGKPARIAFGVAPIRAASGEVEGVIAIGRDLSDLQHLEEQVIQAEKLATLGQLAAGVVHELNNPLTSISVYSEFLLKRGKASSGDPADLEKLSRIVQSADRILRFTRDLVSYARPSTEERRRLALHEVIDQAAVFCEHIVAESGASIEKRYEGGLPPMYGVKGQLHQVFINLITNACHAMPEGAGRLQIETFLRSGRLVARVSDNGVGIPPDQLGRVFEPFFSTKSEGKGTGLGLSIVRNIVQTHDGDIEVESKIGGGTTFEISFPAGEEL